jgi:DNA polymerase III epsilon subunit-like protein
VRFKLRLEPYDPDARDADGDGLVQEGTAWERPAGSRIVDDLGKEIKRGLTSPYRNTRFKIVDKDGNNLDYQPTYGRDADFDPKDEKPTLEKLGYRSIEQMGLSTVADMVLPSTKPQEATPEETPVEEITPEPEVPEVPVESIPEVPKPRYPRQPPAHAMTGLAERKFGKAETWEEFREILAETDIVFLDYETTGLVFDEFGRASSNGKPTQIGAVRMRDGKVIERFNVFVNPGMPMSEWEQWSRDNLVDGDGNPLTDEFFDDKPSIAEAHRQLLDFIGEGTILGMQNAVFDDAVLAEALRESGIDWKPEGIIDTKEMSSMALPRWTPENPDGPSRVDSRTGETVPSNGLADITKYLGVDLGEKHHSADYDAEATGNVLTAIVDGAIEKGWSKDFLDKDKRDEKIRLNDEKFAKEIEQFELDKAAWASSQGIPEVPEATEDPEPQNAEEAIRRFLRQVETGSLPYQLDENEIAEEIFQIRQSYAEETSQQVEEIVGKPSLLSDEQEQAISQVEELVSVIRGLGTDIDEDAFIYRYATDPDTIDLRSTDDPWSAPGRRGDIIRMLPREITGRDGSTYGIKPDLVEIENSGRILIEGLIVDSNGAGIGEFSRSLEVDKDGKLVASHTFLNISSEFRDKGIGSGFNNQMELVYRRLGVDRIEVSASSTIRYEGDERTPMDIQRGVSFWPRQGFDWNNERGPETAITLFGRLFKEGSNEPDPDRVYIEGVSDGPPPVGADRFDVAYFSSKEEWESFAQSFAQLKDVDFDDPGRPVAGDFMRWAGADEWVARRTAGYSPTYVKRLDSPGDDVDVDRSVNDVVARRKEATAEQRQAISQVSTVINESVTSGKGIPSRLDFGSVSLDTESELAEEGAEPDDATSFGIQMLKMFQVETQARDGSTIRIVPDEITTNFGQNGQRAFYVRGVIQGESGVVGRFERTIRTKRQEDGSLVLYVEHDSLNVSAQGQGIGTAFNAELEKVYRELGVSYIQTNAVSGGGAFGNRYIGATHWPRAGFDWSDDFSKSEYIRVLDYLMEPDPETEEMMPTSMAYVEGISSGPRPLPGTGRRQIAYFGSVDEWENFVEAMEQARGESLDDENRIVAGDLVRWEGADDYFAGGEFAFDLIKRLTEE